MNLTTLLTKLLEIERSIGVDADTAVRRKMRDVQDDVLQMQKEKASKLHSKFQIPPPVFTFRNSTDH